MTTRGRSHSSRALASSPSARGRPLIDRAREALKERVAALFRETYQAEPVGVAVAPGRINIIGEHTDYAGGLCLPAAVDRYLAVAAGPAEAIAVVSDGRGAPVGADASDLRPTGGWVDLPLGVLAELARGGVPVSVRLAIASDIPTGAGLSSSAALGVATALVVMGLAGGTVDAYEVARLCRRAENEFLAVPSGLMDQVASVQGRRRHALSFDALSEIAEPVPLPSNLEFLVVESGIERSLRGSPYGDRTREAAEALALARDRHPGLDTLAHLDVAEVEYLSLPEPLNRRARHIAGESQRVRLAVACLEAGNVEALGDLMVASHLSLARDCEVSLPELDALVETAVEAGCVGARLMGAGFGGSVLAAVETDRVADVGVALEAGHRVHRVQVVDGALP
jgi:galactokinase